MKSRLATTAILASLLANTYTIAVPVPLSAASAPASGFPARQFTLGAARLFLSARQRALLEQRRHGVRRTIAPQVAQAGPKSQPTTVPIPPPALVLQGYVRRDNGKNTLWLNRKMLFVDWPDDSGMPVIPARGDDSGVRIRMPDQSVIHLQPGQRFEPAGGKVIDPVK